MKSKNNREQALELQGFCAEVIKQLADGHLAVRQSLSAAAQRYWDNGRLLEELKKRLRGQFVEWLKINRAALGFGRTTAHLYCQFYVQHIEHRDPASLAGLTLVQRTPTGTHAGDVALTPARTGWAGIVNRFELVWQRWEGGGEAEKDEAREVTRPMYERLKRLHEG